MINCKDFDRISARFLEYWNKENHDRPLLCICAPAEKRVEVPKYHGTIRERWMDIDYIIKTTRLGMQNTYYAAEGYPNVYPNLGPDIFGAFFGCDLEFGPSTSWATNHTDDLHKLDLSILDENNFWWKKILEMTEAMAEDAHGDYIVGITDIHPGMDGLASLRGPQDLCFDLYEDGELVEKLTMQLFDRFCEVYNRLNSIVSKYQKGNTNWMGVYHPEGWYVTSSDFQGMISEKMMRRFVLPEIKEELSFLKHSIFHLDGIGALRHLDCLLSEEDLDGIQWVPGAGRESAHDWIPVLKRIQSAGKMIHFSPLTKDIPELLDSLAPEGVLYNVYCSSIDEANWVLRTAEKARPKRLF